jgi:iron complex transport system ATP-binding protein
MSGQFLNIENLVCGYRSFHLESLSFGISKGDFAGIIGPNGSGKTTLLKAITGEIKKEEGKIFLDNKDLSQLSIREKARKIAVVTQQTEDSPISVEDYVLMGRMPYRSSFQFFETKKDKEIAQKYMELTDVFRHKDKPMNQLSGGERQLANIARALTQEPQLLLLDEPTSQLDITHQSQVLNLVQELNDQLGLTVLMVIHDLNLASEYCNYLLLMNEGALRGKGKPIEVLNYRIIEEIYKTIVYTQNNPLSGKPAVFLVSNKMLMKNRDRIK